MQIGGEACRKARDRPQLICSTAFERAHDAVLAASSNDDLGGRWLLCLPRRGLHCDDVLPTRQRLVDVEGRPRRTQTVRFRKRALERPFDADGGGGEENAVAVLRRDQL